MNKNTVIGITLIGLLLIGFSVFNARMAREQAEVKRVQDSIAAAKAFEYAEQMAQARMVSRHTGARMPILSSRRLTTAVRSSTIWKTIN